MIYSSQVTILNGMGVTGKIVGKVCADASCRFRNLEGRGFQSIIGH